MILKTELEARKRDVRELHGRLELVTQGVMDPAIVISDVEPFQKEARLARLEKGRNEVIQVLVP